MIISDFIKYNYPRASNYYHKHASYRIHMRQSIDSIS